MTKQDAIKILMVLRTAYPRFYGGTSEEAAQDAIDLWASIFVDDDAQEVALGVKAFIASDEKGFPPVPGQIKAMMRTAKAHDQPDELKAWGCVKKALRNSCYDSAKEFDKLPPLVRRVVGSPSQLREWCLMDCETLDILVGNSFVRVYREAAQRERSLAALPASDREALTVHHDILCGGLKRAPAIPRKGGERT